MADSKKRPPCVLGFYQTVTRPSGEICGGVLITSHLGRPIEFQCSLPIRPNATQQTLYGATLMPFIKGELIAEALYDKLSAKPDILFVDDPDCVAEGIWGDIGVVCFAALPNSKELQITKSEKGFVTFEHEAAYQKMLPKMKEHLPESATLQEPLVRVQQALEEAMGQAA